MIKSGFWAGLATFIVAIVELQLHPDYTWKTAVSAAAPLVSAALAWITIPPGQGGAK